eukprot:gene1650-1802_t
MSKPVLEEGEDDIDIMDLIASKGIVLEPFKNEYLELQKQLDILLATNTSKERELDQQTMELKILREQITFTRRNIDELSSQQELLKESNENTKLKTENFIQHEEESRQEISMYTTTFTELKEALLIGSDWSPEQLDQRIALEKERDFISGKLENKSNSLTALRIEIEHSYQRIHDLEEEIQKLENQIEEIEQRRHEIKHESSQLIHEKQRIEKDIFDLRSLMNDKEDYLIQKLTNNTNEGKDLRSLDESIIKAKHQMEVYLTDYERMFRSLREVTSHLEKQNESNQKIEEEIQEKIQSMESITIECKKLEKEILLKKQLCQTALKKCDEVDQVKHKTEEKMDQLNKEIGQIRDSEISSSMREREGLEKQLAVIRQELDILRKKHFGSERTTKAVNDLIVLNKNGKLNLGIEIRVLEEEVDQHKANIRQLLTEKEKFEHDAEVSNQQYYTALEELKLQEMQVHELNKKITTDQMKLKQKQSLYESVRSERNLFSKQLVDAQEEIQALKRKFRSMNNQIDQMKEDISAKDHAIVKEHFLHHSVDKERELLKNELTKIRKQVQASEGIIENQRVEIMKLQRIIEEADQERLRQKNELAAVLSERNLLTAQLVKRNTELNTMYEKIKTTRGQLKIGERNYKKYYEDLQGWQAQIQMIVGANNDTVKTLSELDLLKTRKIALEKEISKERTRSRALLDELATPMNVHRWRILESSDPKRYDKITQIHMLQKQFVVMSDKVMQHELLIQEKEKIYIELKNVLARHPGPEVEEQILLYQQTLKEKNKQLAAMNQELEMYIEQVRIFKEDIAGFDNKMMKLNKQWIRRQKKLRDNGNDNIM